MKQKMVGHRQKTRSMLVRLQAQIFRFVGSRAYSVTGAAVLLGTTLYWALLGARLNLSNADQLVSPYLFESGRVFRGADIPSQHTFLLKWPLFYLVKLLGFTASS